MGMMASQVTSLTIVYSAIYSGADQRNHQSSTSLAFVRWIHRWPVNSPHKWPVTRIMFPFQGSHGHGKRTWIWHFAPGREKARNFGLQLWKLICDRENWFYEFCLTNKVIVTETQALICCLFSRKFTNFPSFHPEVLDITGPRFLSVKAKARIDRRAPVIISHMRTELKCGSNKIRETWKLWC